MRLHELFEAIDNHDVYKKPTSDLDNEVGSASPLTYQGDSSWKRDKNSIYNWFKRPFLTNGPKNNYHLPKKSKGK